MSAPPSKLPHLMVCRGNHDIAMWIWVDKIRKQCVASKWDVRTVVGFEQLEDTLDALVGSTLVVVEGDPGDLPAGHPRASVLVLLPGEGKVSSWVEKVPAKHVYVFEQPKPWDELEAAIRFCGEEAIYCGFELDAVVCKRLVKRVGTDFGVLRLEIQKLGMLVGPGGQVESSHLKEALSDGLGGVETGLEIVDAVGLRDGQRLATALKGTPRDASSLLRLLGLLRSSLFTWLHASLWRARSLPPAETAKKLGYHPYRYTKQVLPYMMGWAPHEIAAMMKDLAKVEHGCKGGSHISPWCEIEATLLLHLGG